MKVFGRRSVTGLAASVALLASVPAGPASAAPKPAHRLIPTATIARTITFESPAASRIAGAFREDNPFAQILPSGRFVVPAGKSAVVGMNALGVTLTPDGRYAIVTNDDEYGAREKSVLDTGALGGYSLAVVDTSTMAVVDHYHRSDETYFAGIVAEKDPADPAKTLVLASGGASGFVYAYTLDGSGHLTPLDDHPYVNTSGPLDPAFANIGKSFPSTIVLSSDGARAYVVGNLGNNVAQIDVTKRAPAAQPVPVGYFPLAAARTRRGLLVANEGLTVYGNLSTPTVAPNFVNVPNDPLRASTLSLLPIEPDGSLGSLAATIPLDERRDGVHTLGGTHPASIAAMTKKPYAFVALAGVDRIATVSLSGTPKVVGGTELRFYDKGPFGTQPSAAVLSRDETRLYVALAGINAIAVLDVSDPLQPHRLGLIPTGWYPTALAVSADGRELFVANAKGLSADRGFIGDNESVTDSRGRVLQVAGDSTTMWSTLERIDLRTADLRTTTPQTLSFERVAKNAAKNGVVPQTFSSSSAQIKHIVCILEENKTYDSMLGDLTDANGAPYGPGQAELTAFGADVTPNLHALARTYALAGNFYADAEEPNAGHQVAAGGIASLYTEQTLAVRGGRRPLANANQDPEDYPRSGYIFNSLAAKNLSFRDYGDLLRVSGYDDGQSTNPRVDDPTFAGVNDQIAPTQGLGGQYTLDVPAPAVLSGHVDLNYPGWNLRIRDVRRANEFLRDFDPLVKADAMPAFTDIWLPADHGGAGTGIPNLPEEVADGDRALGQIVDYLTHIPQWSSTAIFIMPASTGETRDHISEHRGYAIVVSPFARRHYLGMKHVSTAGVVKTEEEILGLAPLSLGDALASDLAEFFSGTANLDPYNHIDATSQTASAEGDRIGALLAQTDQRGPGTDAYRNSRLVVLSREADRLAAHRDAMSDVAYARAQGELWGRARALVEDGGDGN